MPTAPANAAAYTTITGSTSSEQGDGKILAGIAAAGT